jgi:hypothetical protein
VATSGFATASALARSSTRVGAEALATVAAGADVEDRGAHAAAGFDDGVDGTAAGNWTRRCGTTLGLLDLLLHRLGLRLRWFGLWLGLRLWLDQRARSWRGRWTGGNHNWARLNLRLGRLDRFGQRRRDHVALYWSAVRSRIGLRIRRG